MSYLATSATSEPLPLLKAKEAAEYLRVHRCTLYRLEGLPFVLVGKRRRWRAEDLRGWVEAQLQNGKEGA